MRLAIDPIPLWVVTFKVCLALSMLMSQVFASRSGFITPFFGVVLSGEMCIFSTSTWWNVSSFSVLVILTRQRYTVNVYLRLPVDCYDVEGRLPCDREQKDAGVSSWGVSGSGHADPDIYYPDLHSAYRAGPS